MVSGPAFAGLTTLETRLLGLANEERRRAGVPPLVSDAVLVRAARFHSRSMRDLGFFGHVSPLPRMGTTESRMRSFGITETRHGENVGIHGSGRESASAVDLVEELHRRLMRSSPHRANILDPGFNRVGIGIVTGETEADGPAPVPIPAVWATQNFLLRRVDFFPLRARPTATGIRFRLGGRSVAVGDTVSTPLWLRARSSRNEESIVALDFEDGTFATEMELPAGDGRYSVEIAAGPDTRRLTTLNAVTVDTDSPPRKALR